MQVAHGSESVTLNLPEFLGSEERWQAYLQRMENTSEFGDHIMLVGAAAYLGRPIIIIGSSPQGNVDSNITMVTCLPQDMHWPALVLGHRFEDHYESLVPGRVT